MCNLFTFDHDVEELVLKGWENIDKGDDVAEIQFRRDLHSVAYTSPSAIIHLLTISISIMVNIGWVSMFYQHSKLVACQR